MGRMNLNDQSISAEKRFAMPAIISIKIFFCMLTDENFRTIAFQWLHRDALPRVTSVKVPHHLRNRSKLAFERGSISQFDRKRTPKHRCIMIRFARVHHKRELIPETSRRLPRWVVLQR